MKICGNCTYYEAASKICKMGSGVKREVSFYCPVKRKKITPAEPADFCSSFIHKGEEEEFDGSGIS